MTDTLDHRRRLPSRRLVCGMCGYGISLGTTSCPPCPMCRGIAWVREPERVNRLWIESA